MEPNTKHDQPARRLYACFSEYGAQITRWTDSRRAHHDCISVSSMRSGPYTLRDQQGTVWDTYTNGVMHL